MVTFRLCITLPSPDHEGYIFNSSEYSQETYLSDHASIGFARYFFSQNYKLAG
jgi:hypothetical protein